ncbi:cytoplasmic fragile-X interacting family-domain-containing protein [Phlyctochytrium arcticum]|nr:cytoplasmic fragile-X interacting family-domain-containing protein [Phlyctochytrium arcticum]
MTQVATPDPDSYLSRLNALPFRDETPLVTASPIAISIGGCIHDLNLADSSLYAPDMTVEKSLQQSIGFSIKESIYLGKMNALLEEGQRLLSSLYYYRSCSRAIPQVQSNEQANRLQIYQKTYEVLQPEVKKMLKFMSFRDVAISGVSDVLAELVPEMKERDFFLSVDFLDTSAKLLDMFVIMDAMKNIKGSMNNDFSMYRRANRDVGEDETIMQHKLYSFLANSDQYSSELKNSLHKLPPGFEEILVEIVEHCADRIESGMYIFPKQKHTYYRTIAFGLYLLDSDGEDHDITKRKKFKLERLGKILKGCPVVPLFADQYIHLSSIYGKAPHLSSNRWEETDDAGKANLAKHYTIVNHLDNDRREYMEYISSFKRVTNAIKGVDKPHGSLSQELAAGVYNIVLRGIRTLAMCTTRVLEQSAWKYANPVNPSLNPSIPADSLSYELAVRFNYSNEEKRALIEYIAMIKNLSSLLSGLDRLFYAAINQYIYVDIQSMAKNHITEFYTHASKKKRPVAGVMKHLRDVLFDGPLPEDDNSPKKSRPATASTMSDPQGRPNPITPSLLQLVRTILNSCFSEKAKGMKGGLMREKDFKESQVEEVKDFLTRSSMYLCMLDIDGTVSQLNDLADLWFKEFYLELSKKVQFPISMSLPWILTEHILESNDTEMLQYVLYPFELYNDAAFRTLYSLKSKFIYDEVNAEVSLCFDQLIFKLSQKMFVHFKKVASNTILAADLKNTTEEAAGLEPALDAYDTFLAQQNYQLLGRSLNMKELIGQMMNQYIRKSIDIAIGRYEGSDLTYLADLDTLLRSAQLTHQLVSERVTVDRFEDMLQEVDESVSISVSNGRILSHTLNQLVNDFIPNFCFNSVTNRFLRGPISFVQEATRHNFPKAPLLYLYGSKALSVAFAAQNSLYKDFIGEAHFRLIRKWVGKHGISIMIAELSKIVDMNIKHTMTAYIGVISKGTPQTMKLPLFEYGTAGTFEYFNAHLKPLVTYPSLKSDVLQSFREVGNIVLCVKMFEDVIAVENPWADIQSLEFVPHGPDSKTTAFAKLRDFDEVLGSDGYALPYRAWVEDAENLYAPNPPTSLFAPFLRHLRTTLDSVAEQWQADGQLENPRAFFRIWSALQFTFCVPSVGEGRLLRELFGEGLSWAGCTLIHLLSQVDVYTAFDFNNHCLSVQRADRKNGNLSFGFGQYGGNVGSPSGEKGSSPMTDSATPQQAAAAAIATGLRPDVVQFLESAAFYQNVNEEIFASLVGMEAVA